MLNRRSNDNKGRDGMEIKYRRNSIAFKLAVALMLFVMLQCLLLSLVLILGGVIQQAEDSGIRSFSEKVHNRKVDLENQMNTIWTNFSQYTNQVAEDFSDYDPHEATARTTDAYLANVTPHLVDMLRSSKTTGVFLVLNDNKPGENKHSALYIRDSDPIKNGSDNADLYLMAGPWNVSQTFGMATDQKWNLQLTLTKENEDFYKKPYYAIGLSENKALLGYWAAPFHLMPDDEAIMTYSLPLTNKQGVPIGVIGVEIATEYLYRFLPATDLQARDSLGYAIGVRTKGQDDIRPVVTQSALLQRLLPSEEALSLSATKQADMFLLNNHSGQKPIYACANQLSLYNNNTPFAEEEWYLLGFMEESMLMQSSNKITWILITSLGISMLIGLLIAIVISNWLTKPIVALAENVKDHISDVWHPLKKTGLAEIDDLSTAIEISQKRLMRLSNTLSRIIDLPNIPFGAFEIGEEGERVFATTGLCHLLNLSEEEMTEMCYDPKTFNQGLADICQVNWDDPEIFHLHKDGTEKWIRISQTKTADGVIGVVIDVTQEIIQTLSIKLERDRDSLTGIGNRNAYQEMLMQWEAKLPTTVLVGIGVFDLNGLKFVNDSYGHNAGDDYICKSAEFICSTFLHCPIFRIGGDEFVAFLVRMESETVEAMHKALLAKVDAYNKQHTMQMGIAFGYAFYNALEDEQMGDVFAKADDRMYENKVQMKQRNMN